MIIQKIRTVFLLLVVACGLTSCSSAFLPDAYYNGQQPIKDKFALVFASTTADVSLGSALITYIQLENLQTKKTLNLENRTCILTKNSPGMGLIAQAIMEGKTKKDQISVNNICGSLVVGEIEAGEYELKNLEIKSNNLAQGGLVDSITYVPPTKQTFNINGNEIVYLGHIETWALDMRGSFTIRSASVLMNDNYEYDSTIFKQTYKIHEASFIRDNAIILGSKKLQGYR